MAKYPKSKPKNLENFSIPKDKPNFNIVPAPKKKNNYGYVFDPSLEVITNNAGAVYKAYKNLPVQPVVKKGYIGLKKTYDF
tara:strand:- start:610 stop:852 length:243 start_codon:yes stop_codon:yes gene_type:complete